MPTIRQRKLAKALIENSVVDKPLNKQELVASVGYSEIVADKKATEILESKGTVEALEDLGFTEDNAKRVVQEILLDESNEPNARLKAADMVFKVKGTYAPEKSVNLNITQKPNEKIKKLTDELRRIQRRGNSSGN